MRKNLFFRYLTVAVAFCLVSVVYLGRLFYIQIAGRETSYEEGTKSRTVTLQAVRGEIYDRNGKALVTNRYTYDLTILSSSFSALTTKEANRMLLTLAEILKSRNASDLHTEKYFPFEGCYPYYSESEATASGDSVEYYRLQRVYSDLKMKAEKMTTKKLIDYYVSEYELLAVENDGTRLYSDDEIDLLIRMRYELDAVRFANTGSYTYSSDIGMELMTCIREQNLSGVTFAVSAERVYHYPGYASHILGTVGPIYSEEWSYYNELGYQMNAVVGKSGCEYAFEQYLHGQDGVMILEEDSAGNVVSSRIKTEPIAGNDVYLTIDIDLQIAAEDGLAENVAYVADHAYSVATGLGCQAGAAVAMDPETFDVLAIASYPTYDLSTYHEDYSLLLTADASPLLNRALNGSYAPGSTLKPGIAVAALMEGKISPSTLLNCDGVYRRYDDYQPHCWVYDSETSSVKRHGAIDVVNAIAVSCNCFFYELGYRLGIDVMDEYLTAFGIGQSTGIELGGTTGVLAGPAYRAEHHLDPWVAGLDLQVAIGQSDNQASPMQLACYISALMNGGTRYTAHLLDRVQAFGDPDPLLVFEQTEETVLSRATISASALSAVKEGMREMVSSNTTVSRFMANVPKTVIGKTGSAQNPSGCENALFVAASPASAPEIVIAVAIEQGYTGAYASLTAARILEAYWKD